MSSSFVPSSSPSISAEYRLRSVPEQKEQEIQYKHKRKELEQQNGSIVSIEQKFGKPENSHFELLAQETIGLVSFEDFVKKREYIVGGTYDQQKKTEMEKQKEFNRLNRKSKVEKTQLSFNMDEEDEHYTNEESKKEKKQEIQETKEVGEKVSTDKEESFVKFQEPKTKKQS